MNSQNMCEYDAFYICLSHWLKLIKLFGDDAQESFGREISVAENICILEMINDVEPEKLDKWYFDIFNAKTKKLFSIFSNALERERWITNKLKNYDEEELERFCGIGKNKYCDFCEYENIELFLKDIEHDFILFVLNTSWEEALDQDATNKARMSVLLTESKSEDNKKVLTQAEQKSNAEDHLKHLKKTTKKICKENKEFSDDLITFIKSEVKEIYETSDAWEGNNPDLIKKWEYEIMAGYVIDIVNKYLISPEEGRRRLTEWFLEIAHIEKIFPELSLKPLIELGIAYRLMIELQNDPEYSEKDPEEIIEIAFKFVDFAVKTRDAILKEEQTDEKKKDEFLEGAIKNYLPVEQESTANKKGSDDDNVINYSSKQSNIFTSVDSYETNWKRMNNLFFLFWECTPLSKTEIAPQLLKSENEDKTINISYTNGKKVSCFYTIKKDGKVVVKETGEVLNLNDFSHLVAIIATIMKDLFGEFDRQEVINKFREEILNSEEIK